VLAGGGFAAGNAAIQKARKTTALAAATALESAVNSFFLEYGSMPVAAGTSDTELQTDQAAGKTLLQVLLALEPEGSAMLNPRKIKFLSAKEGKAKKNGLIYNSAGTDVEGFFDPWGGPYFLMMDLDYDERLTVSPKATPKTTSTLNGRRVAVWSNGADCTGLAGSSGAGKATDDVKTWGN
jgi:hypothetical protein